MSCSVAVVISTYNSPSYLRQVLRGYLLQTRFPDELIVADDGSTAETAEIVARFAEQAPFPVRHVWHPDEGFRLAAIRNRAIETATAEYLVFTDGDCVPHRSFVADHAALAEPGCFVTGKRILVGQEASAGEIPFASMGTLPLLGMCLRGQLSGWHHLLHIPAVRLTHRKRLRGIRGCNMAAFREDLFRVNGFNESFVGWGREDSEFAARLYNLGLRRRVFPFAAVVFHLWHREAARGALAENDRLLGDAIASGTSYCANGIVKEASANGERP